MSDERLPSDYYYNDNDDNNNDSNSCDWCHTSLSECRRDETQRDDDGAILTDRRRVYLIATVCHCLQITDI